MSQYAFWTTLLLDVVIKVSLLLLVVWAGSLFMRKRSAAAQHRWWTLGFVGCLLIPVISFITPTWTLPILPGPTEIADPSQVENISWASNRAFVDPTPSRLAEQARQRGMPPRQQSTRLDESTRAFGEQPTVATKDSAVVSAITSATKFLLFFWIVGIAICWSRSIWQHVLLRRLMNCCVRLDDPEWNELVTKCSQLLGLSQKVSLLRHKAAHPPVSAGVRYPVVILPEDAESWGADHRRSVLLHELAHVARRDVLAQTLAGLACGLYWFNPLCWLGLFQMRKFRELACDDVVLSCGQQPSGYADVLLSTARSYRHPSYSTAVSMAHSTNVENRIMAVLDKTRRHVSLSRTTARLLLASAAALVCLVGTAQLRSQAESSARATGQDETSVEAAGEMPRQDANATVSLLPGEIQRDKREHPANAQVASTQSLHITIVGPGGKPVGGIGVEIRGLSKFDRSRLKVGTFVEKRRYGISVRANDAGELELDFGEEPPRRLGLHITEPGYGPYWANWDSSDHPQPIPAEFTVRLERGWSVGGVVVNEEGQPIAGAKVRLSIEYKKRPGDTRQMGAGARITTAADGSWRFDSVPDSYADVTVEITHPEHSNAIASLARGSYAVAPEAKPDESIIMPRGLTVTGRVTDNLGQPIVGATVRTKFHNDVRRASTDKDGRYRLVGCKPKMARIVVSAPGKAMELQEVRVDPDMTPVDFVLQGGGNVRIKVVDENGVGIPKATIFFQSWRGRIEYFEFDHVNQYANDQGVWEWNEAPLDEFEVDICRPGGMQLTDQKIKARDEEYIFSPSPKLTIAGSVVDAKTGAPIEKFRVVRGLRNKDSRIGIDWIENDAYEATDGAYRVTFDRVPLAALVRVEAIGYRAKASRDIKPDETQISYHFELERGDALVATIVRPDGKPAAEAKIALGVAGSQINITNGDIGDGQTYAQRLSSDQEGQFELPARDDAFHLVITHDAGFAHVKSTDGPIPDRIALTPWARVEGVFRVGAKPMPGVVLELYGDAIHSYGPEVPNIFTNHNVTTGPVGQYVFERVVPGKGWIGRRILLMVNEGATEVTSSSRVSAEFIAGQTTKLDLGGTGRPVVGKLLPPKSHDGRVFWNFALVNLEAALEEPELPTPPKEVAGDVDKRAAWWKAWKETPDGKAWSEAYQQWRAAKEAAPYLTASVSHDGSFRFDDTPLGDYVLRVRHDERLPGTLEQRVNVPSSSEGDAPVDLGALRLKSQNTRYRQRR